MEEDGLKRLGLLGFLILLVAVLGLAAAACGGDDDDGGGEATALPSASCGPIRMGEEQPDALIASDLPLQGANRSLTTEMADAIQLVLEQRDYKAGDLVLGYQSCDDSTAQAGSWDSAKCSSNARAYANNYYPTGKRNYARVVWNDQFQGAANALLAKELGLSKVFVLNDSETYGLGIATLFVDYAKKQGIQILGNQKWDKKASSYESLASRISATNPDAIFLGGIVCNNGGKLIKDLKAGNPDVQLPGPDGWTPISATIEGGGAAANDMYITQPGIPVDQLQGAGKEFVDAFGAKYGKAPNPYTVYAAQAAVVLLDAIERGGDDRAKVSEELFNTDIKDGILGDFQIDENGDTTLGTVSVYQVKDGKEAFVKVITPELSFVEGG